MIVTTQCLTTLWHYEKKDYVILVLRRVWLQTDHGMVIMMEQWGRRWCYCVSSVGDKISFLFRSFLLFVFSLFCCFSCRHFYEKNVLLLTASSCLQRCYVGRRIWFVFSRFCSVRRGTGGLQASKGVISRGDRIFHVSCRISAVYLFYFYWYYACVCMCARPSSCVFLWPCLFISNPNRRSKNQNIDHAQKPGAVDLWPTDWPTKERATGCWLWCYYLLFFFVLFFLFSLTYSHQNTKPQQWTGR